jgi:hypothetical protein
MSVGRHSEHYAMIAGTPVITRVIMFSLSNIINRYKNRNLAVPGRFRPLAQTLARLWRSAAQSYGNSIFPRLVIAANAVALVLNVKTTSDMATRSGMVTTINLALLLAGSQFDIVASIQGDSLRSQITMHRHLSLATTVAAILHVLAVILNEEMALRPLVFWGSMVSKFFGER